ncbi:MAG: SDR family NAD(P)-dependent oxidoreductase [Proteobacteria bacterium]|nr:SDR family NAD(P)-dependent oxidoreductase [Pseudomonadota bacterium]
MNIKGITAIVTGGASGMGAATARALVAAGAKIALWDMNGDAAQKVASECGGLAVVCDVTDEDSVKAAIEKSGPARVLVNCAGILIGKRVVGKDGPADLAHFQKVINVNLVGSFNTMRLAATEMAKLEPVDADGSRGVVINTASIAAWEGQIGQAAYSASKGGIVGMTLPAARDLGKLGIRVMAIAPGAVATPMIGGLTPEIQASLESAIPFPSRFVKAEEFAKLVLHIVENNMLNGSVIRLDGASRLAAK